MWLLRSLPNSWTIKHFLMVFISWLRHFEIPNCVSNWYIHLYNFKDAQMGVPAKRYCVFLLNNIDVRRMSNNNSIRLSCHVLREAGCKKAQKTGSASWRIQSTCFWKTLFQYFRFIRPLRGRFLFYLLPGHSGRAIIIWPASWRVRKNS